MTEREEWAALVEADLDGLPREALVASVHALAQRLLDLTEAFGLDDDQGPDR